ncbi:Uncharacterised protein [Flavobacterium hibernum]|nr:Uncharacterised protein [Flavobacterium hibernum]
MSNIESALQIEKRSTIIPMIILTALFFILGFVTWLNGPLIPFLS